MTESPSELDELGPVDYIVVEYPKHKPTGEAFAALLDLVDAGLIRVLDLVFVLSLIPDFCWGEDRQAPLLNVGLHAVRDREDQVVGGPTLSKTASLLEAVLTVSQNNDGVGMGRVVCRRVPNPLQDERQHHGNRNAEEREEGDDDSKEA